MQVPEKISVATDADFKVNLGTIKYNLSETLNSKAITEQMQENLGDNMGLYKYIPDDNPSTQDVDESDTLSYLVHCPVYGIPFANINGNIADINLDTAIKGNNLNFNPGSSIELPTVEGADKKEVGVTIMNDLQQQINDNLDQNSNTLTAYEPGLAQELSNKFGCIDVNSDAEHIYYMPGSKILITFTRKDTNEFGNGFSLGARAFIAEHSDGTSVISESCPRASAYPEIRDGGTIELPVDMDTGLPQLFYICMEGSASNGDLGIQHIYDVKISLSDGAEIKKIQNILKTSDELGVTPQTFDVSVDTDLSGKFESARISEGNISMFTSPVQGWEGITTTVNMKFNDEDIQPSKITDYDDGVPRLFNKRVDLAGTEIVPESTSIRISGSVQLEVLGATIDFEQSNPENLEIDFSYEVKKLADVVVDLESSGIQTSYSLPTDGSSGSVELPDNMKAYIKKLSLGTESGGKYYKHDKDENLDMTAESEGLGFKFNVTNTFPTDDFVLKIHSDVFNFDCSQVIPSGTNDEQMSWISYNEIDFTGLGSGKTYVDYTFEFVNKKITLSEVTMGDTYTFSMDVNNMEMPFDWDYAVLDTAGTKKEGSTDLAAFSLSELLDGLSLGDDSTKKLRVAALPTFFYANKPDEDDISNPQLKSLLRELKIGGTIQLDYSCMVGEGESAALVAQTPIELFNGNELKWKDNELPWPEENSTIIASEEMIASLNDTENTYSSLIIPYITEDTSASSEDQKYSFKADLADIANTYPEEMKFTYDLSLSMGTDNETKIYSAWTDSSASSGSGSSSEENPPEIKIEMAILLSFNLRLYDDIKIDVMKYYDENWNTTNADKDLLYRDDDSKIKDYKKYCDAIERVGMMYTVKNDLFPSLDLAGSFEDEATSIKKEFLLYEKRVNTLNFSGKELERIIDTNPFHPTAEIILKGPVAQDENVLYDNAGDPYKLLNISRKSIDSEEGACLSATVSLLMNFTDKKYVTVLGDD